MDYYVDSNFLMDQKLMILHQIHDMNLKREFCLFGQNHANGQDYFVERYSSRCCERVGGLLLCRVYCLVNILLHFEVERIKLPADTGSDTIHANRSCDFLVQSSIQI